MDLKNHNCCCQKPQFWRVSDIFGHLFFSPPKIGFFCIHTAEVRGMDAKLWKRFLLVNLLPPKFFENLLVCYPVTPQKNWKLTLLVTLLHPQKINKQNKNNFFNPIFGQKPYFFWQKNTILTEICQTCGFWQKKYGFWQKIGLKKMFLFLLVTLLHPNF